MWRAIASAISSLVLAPEAANAVRIAARERIATSMPFFLANSAMSLPMSWMRGARWAASSSKASSAITSG